MSSPIHSRHQSFGPGNFPFVDAPVQTGGNEIARHAEERKTVLQYCPGVSLNIVKEEKKTLLERKNHKELLHMKMVQCHPANCSIDLETDFHRIGNESIVSIMVRE